MRYFGNQTPTQIAAQLCISQMHVARLLARSLQQLRRGLRNMNRQAVGPGMGRTGGRRVWSRLRDRDPCLRLISLVHPVTSPNEQCVFGSVREIRFTVRRWEIFRFRRRRWCTPRAPI
nr:sigma factor-like helix-turn-helix DNA-binding protein [Actinomadura sp. KC06]